VEAGGGEGGGVGAGARLSRTNETSSNVKKYETYETTDDRGTNMGVAEDALDKVVPVNEVDAPFGTNTGALTAWAVRDA
jgi:hypothetical protein